MTLFVFTTFALSLLFAAVMASWYGGMAFYAIPAGTLVAAAFLLAVAKRQLRSGRIDGRERDASGASWAGEACSAIPAAALILRGPVVSFANRAFLELLDMGEHGDEVTGMPFTNLLHPGDHHRFAAMQGCRSEDGPRLQDDLLRLVRADGSTLRAHAALTPMASEPGCCLLQFRADAAAGTPREPTTETLQLLLDQLESVFFKTDKAGRLVFLSRAWERLTGRGATTSRGASLAAAVHPEERESLERGLAAIIQGDSRAFATELRFVHLAGHVLRGALRANACVDAAGEVHGIVGTISDIDRRRRDDEGMVARRQVDTLLVNVPGMVYRGRNDPEWTMDFVSDGCLALTGYEPWELVGRQGVTFASLIHPEDRAFVWGQVQSALEVRRPYQIAYRLRHASGRILHVWEQGRGAFSAQGDLLSIEGFITDVDIRSSAREGARSRVAFDARTGMTSRTVFTQLLVWTLHQSTIRSLRFAVLWIDIGVPEGDGDATSETRLEAVARRFSSVNRPGSLVTYMDEWRFAVLLSDLRMTDDARPVTAARAVVGATSRIAGLLAAELAQPLRSEGREVVPEVAIGIALSDRRHLGAEGLLDAARRAAAQARALGPGRCEFSED
ncbi:MAG: PAS domain S-box protein [Rhodocyclaceae bacterium]|nr:PAS domain S-box protein [Rhodocyclaceae bacterium]